MIEEMVVDTILDSVDSKSKEDKIQKESLDTIDENDNVVDASKQLEEVKEGVEDKKESSEESSKEGSEDKKTENEAANENKHESKTNVLLQEMDIIHAIKALNDKNGSSANAIKSQLEKEKKAGDGGIKKKNVLQILSKGIKQKFIQQKDDKYTLTHKGRKLGRKAESKNPSSEKKEDEKMEVEESDSSQQKSEVDSKINKNDSKNLAEDKVEATEKKDEIQEDAKRSKSDVTTREMIVLALKSGDARKGMSLLQIQKFVEKKYKMGLRHNEVIKKTLRKGVQKNVFINEGGNYKLKRENDAKEKVKLPTDNPSNGSKDQISKKKKEMAKEGEKEAKKTSVPSMELNNNKAEKESSIGDTILNAIMDLEKLTREGSTVGKIKQEMISKYKMDESKFSQFLKDGIKRRGMKKVDKKPKWLS